VLLSTEKGTGKIVKKKFDLDDTREAKNEFIANFIRLSIDGTSINTCVQQNPKNNKADLSSFDKKRSKKSSPQDHILHRPIAILKRESSRESICNISQVISLL
jgi:hypothetical protein